MVMTYICTQGCVIKDYTTKQVKHDFEYKNVEIQKKGGWRHGRTIIYILTVVC